MLINIVGNRYGRLVVKERKEGSWLCQCDCGKPHVAKIKHLKSGATKSCGCLRSENSARLRTAEALPFEQRLKLNEQTGCLEWQGSRDRGGYGTLRSGKRDHKAHRVAYEKHYGAIPKRLFVLHECDNPPCCNPEHLFLGTPSINSADMVSNGRQAKGENNGYSKLTDRLVQKIRRLAEKGKTQQEIADFFGVDQTNISNIVLRKTWKHVR